MSVTTEALYTPTRWEVLEAKNWENLSDEQKKVFEKAFMSYVQAYGKPFVVRFSGTDLRVMWGKEIKVDKLKQAVRSPTGSSYDCPLCQPYDPYVDQWEQERRFLCKVIDPRYKSEMSNGVWLKCPCLIDSPSSKRR